MVLSSRIAVISPKTSARGMAKPGSSGRRVRVARRQDVLLVAAGRVRQDRHLLLEAVDDDVLADPDPVVVRALLDVVAVVDRAPG